MKIIVAADKNWGIGKDNKLLVSIPADMKMFRQETTGKVCVMGRKTVENVQRLARWWSTLWKTPTVRNVSVADGVSRHVRYTPLQVGARDNRNVFTIFMGINFMYVL